MHVETLVRMAQQIAINNSAVPFEESAAKIAGHLRAFWTPAMLRELEAYAAFSPRELNPRLIAALDLLGEADSA